VTLKNLAKEPVIISFTPVYIDVAGGHDTERCENVQIKSGEVWQCVAASLHCVVVVSCSAAMTLGTARMLNSNVVRCENVRVNGSVHMFFVCVRVILCFLSWLCYVISSSVSAPVSVYVSVFVSVSVSVSLSISMPVSVSVSVSVSVGLRIHSVCAWCIWALYILSTRSQRRSD